MQNSLLYTFTLLRNKFFNLYDLFVKCISIVKDTHLIKATVRQVYILTLLLFFIIFPPNSSFLGIELYSYAI